MKSLIVVATLFALAGCKAQESAVPAETTEKPAPRNAAQTAYAKANEAMHKGMASIPADADVAFMQGMIAHHQGAIDMAKVVLEHGKDAKTRAMAEAIIKAQSAEIAEMRAWLKERSGAGSAEVDHAAMGH